MQSRDEDGTQPELSSVRDALDALVGTEVELVSEVFPGRGPLKGVARWSEAQPACAPRFVKIGDNSGIPVGSHTVTDVELVAGGGRWTDSRGKTPLVAPRENIEAVAGTEADADPEGATEVPRSGPAGRGTDERREPSSPELAAALDRLDEMSDEELTVWLAGVLRESESNPRYEALATIIRDSMRRVNEIDGEAFREFLAPEVDDGTAGTQEEGP